MLRTTPKPPRLPSLALVGPDAAGPSSPRPLGPWGRSLWDRVMAQYRIEDAGGIEMLTIACQAIDRSESCREEIDRAGRMIKTSTGMRSHPLIRDELQCRALAMRTIDKLGINHEALKSVGRAPGSIGWTPRED